MLVEDHTILRRCLRRSIEDDPMLNVIAEAGNGADAVCLFRQFRPKVVVMDLEMPDLDGARATAEMMKIEPATAVLILSLDADERDVKRAFSAGAQGYLQKNAVGLDLNDAIKKIAGGARIDPSLCAVARTGM